MVKDICWEGSGTVFLLLLGYTLLWKSAHRPKQDGPTWLLRGAGGHPLPITLPQVLPWPGPSSSCSRAHGGPFSLRARRPLHCSLLRDAGIPPPRSGRVSPLFAGTRAFYPQELRVGGVLPARWMQSCLRETLGRKEEASDMLPSPPGSRTHHTKHFGEQSPQFRRFGRK